MVLSSPIKIPNLIITLLNLSLLVAVGSSNIDSYFVEFVAVLLCNLTVFALLWVYESSI